jgi:hypothetical protein
MTDATWTTKDGTVILIRDMEDRHLLNTLALLQRCAEAERVRVSMAYLCFAGPQGEMAQIAFERECDRVDESTWRDYVHPAYGELEGEATRRGLTVPVVVTKDAALSHDVAVLRRFTEATTMTDTDERGKGEWWLMRGNYKLYLAVGDDSDNDIALIYREEFAPLLLQAPRLAEVLDRLVLAHEMMIATIQDRYADKCDVERSEASFAEEAMRVAADAAALKAEREKG